MSKGPFGQLYQHEAEYLALVSVDALDAHLLVVVRMRLDGRTKTCHDTLPVLAYYAGMSPRRVGDGLKRLDDLGIVERKRHLVRGGPRGLTWTWTTTPQPYESWSREPLIRQIAARVAYVRTFHQDAAGAPSSLMSAHETTDEDAQNEGSGRTPTRHIPESYPRDLSRGARASRATSSELSEDGAAADVERLVGTWVAEREGRDLERFTDPVARRWLRDAARAALGDGCAVADLDAALRTHVGDEYADPRQFPAWAAEVRDVRLEREASIRSTREHIAREQERDARLARERSDPEAQARIRAILEEGRARLRGAA